MPPSLKKFTGPKTKRLLVAHGDSSSIANFREKKSLLYFEGYLEFFRYFEILINSFFSRFLTKPLTIFCWTLVGKHFSVFPVKTINIVPLRPVHGTFMVVSPCQYHSANAQYLSSPSQLFQRTKRLGLGIFIQNCVFFFVCQETVDSKETSCKL